MSKKEFSVSSGKITKIQKIENSDNFEFMHSIGTNFGSSGAPIILDNTLKVIGIHKSGNEKINYGTFIGEIFKIHRFSQKEIERFEKPKIPINSYKCKNFNNYIIGTINISENDINKEIRIINSYEEFIREQNRNKYTIKIEEEEKYKNEKEIKECIIKIDDKQLSSFSYFHKFKQVKYYTIKYTFNNFLTNCSCMFSYCKNLIYLNLSNFNTKIVKSMWCMFYSCSDLVELNLSNINTRNVRYMHCMFYKCSSLKNLDLSSFNAENVEDMAYMFEKCESLKNGNLTINDSSILDEYKKIINN